MYNDITNNATYNVKTARLFGLNTAVYWAALCDISVQVVKKQTFDENGYFKLCRDYVEMMTALSTKEQYQCDVQLSKVGLLEVHPDDPDKIGIHLKEWVALITEDDPETLKLVLAQSKRTGRTAKEGKQAGYKKNCKTAIVTDSPEELAALERWIDAVVDAEKGLCSGKQVEVFQKTLNEAYPEDLAARLKIIEIATARLYKDSSWAIQIFRQQYPAGLQQQQVKATRFSDETF